MGSSLRYAFEKLFEEYPQLQPGQEASEQFNSCSTYELHTGKIKVLSSGDARCITEGTQKPVLISQQKLAGAMQDDEVAVEVEVAVSNGYKRGKVVKILRRAHPMLCAQLHLTAEGAVAIPVNHRISNQIKICEIADAKDKDYVWVEILSGNDEGTPLGEIRAILGNPSTSGIDEKLVIYEYQFSNEFPQESLEEINHISDSIVEEEEIKKRRDLRSKLIFTIDAAGSEALDDALSIERLENGFRLGVHISDPTYYVKYGSLLDDEAYKRGTSVYFAGRFALPMLPPSISYDMCSLLPHRDRLAISCVMDIDTTGALVKPPEIFLSTVRSKVRLTYSQVNRILDSESTGKIMQDAQIYHSLRILAQLSEILHQNRLEADSLDLDLPEIEFVFDDAGGVMDIREAEKGIAHRIVEECMLAANRAMTGEMLGWPTIFKAQDAPQEEVRIQELKELLLARGYAWPSEGMVSPAILSDVLRQAREKSEEELIKRQILNISTKSFYSAEPKPHFNLSFDSYATFTSPIRSYADLWNQRALKALVEEDIEQLLVMEEKVEEVAETITEKRQLAKWAQTLYEKWKTAEFLARQDGQVFEAWIYNVNDYGLSIILEDFPIRGFIRLNNDYIYIQKRGIWFNRMTQQELGIDQKVAVRVIVEQSKKDFSFVLHDTVRLSRR